MAPIHGCHVTSREAILFMKYEHYGKCKGSFKDSQRKCKYINLKHDCRKYDTVTERTVEALKAVRVLKTFYKRDNEQNLSGFKTIF